MDNNKIISIQDLFIGRCEDFDKSREIKIMRLSENKKWDFGNITADTIHNLCKQNREAFKKWVSCWPKNSKQVKQILSSEFIVFMVAETGLASRFLGVYKVKDNKVNIVDSDVYINLEECKGFESLNERIVVEWGEKKQSSQAWSQNWYHNKKTREFNYKYVTRIDEGIHSPIVPFVSYNDVLLNFKQLKNIIEYEDLIWKSKLEAVNCIYCITDVSNGKRYIGSTYSRKRSENGIWGRWKTYVLTGGHGGNNQLVKLSETEGPDYLQNNFEWIILEVLPSKITDKEAVGRENVYKEKFHTRNPKFGYNDN